MSSEHPAGRWRPVRPVLMAVVSGAAEAVACARGAAVGGADLVQVREHGTSDGDLLRLVRRVREVVEPAGARVLVNDRIDVALAAGAVGVHLKAGGPSPETLRRLAADAGRPGLLLSQATHGPEDVAAALASAELDWVVHGPLGAVPGKQPVGLEELRRRLAPDHATAADASPGWIVLGGVGLADVRRLAALAADHGRTTSWGVAVMRAVSGGEARARSGARAFRAELDATIASAG